MCIYYRFTCGKCSLIQDRVLPCHPAHLRQTLCEVLQQVALSPQVLQGGVPICQKCGVAQYPLQRPAQTALSQERWDGQAQQPFQVRRGINLHETLRKYNEARSQVFALVEEEMSKKKKAEKVTGSNKQEGDKREDCAFEKAWKQLKTKIEKA